MRYFKKMFVLIWVFALSTVLVSQIMLKNTFLKNRLSVLHNIEARYVYSEKEINSGNIVVEVYNPSEKLFLMQNGVRISSLSKSQTTIDISDNSVIEIDGRNTDTICKIKIIEVSNNIDGFYEKEVITNSNIVILGRFFVK